MRIYPATTTDTLFQTTIEWAYFSGDWVISTLANMELGAYLGLVE